MKIIIGGDFTTQYRGLKSLLDEKAFSPTIIEHFHNTDYTILNLESPVADEFCSPINKVGPCLKTSEEAITFLKRSGIHAVTLANNHFFDYGRKAVNKTIECLTNEDIDYVGGGRTNEELRNLLYKQIGNERIVILNYCEKEFSIQDGIGSNHLNPISVFYDIQKAKKNADIIIVITHGGHEHYQLPSPRMQELYRYIVDLGANIVINHHQHCYSGYEKYHNGTIFYGLGNFFFDDKTLKGNWNEGFYVELEITNHQIVDYKLFPYIQCTTKEATVNLMNKTEKEKFMSNIMDLNSIISDNTKLKESFNHYCESKAKGYTIDFTPYSNRYLKALCKRGFLPSFFSYKRKKIALNDIQCESHRDIMLYALKK